MTVNASRTVYAVHLCLAGEPPASRARARALARRWLVGRVGEWPASADPARCSWSPRPDEMVVCRSADADGEAFWEMTWRHPHETDPSMRWSAVVLVGGDREQAWAQARYGLEAAEGCEDVSGWVEYDARRPHLVHTLVDKLHVTDAGRRLTPGPMRIDDRADVDRMVQLITAPDRRLPVMVGTRRRGTTEPDAPLPALADTCIGLAHVADVRDPSLTFELSDQLGRPHGVHSGALRVYFTGWSPEDRPSRHQLWKSDEMRGDRFGGFAQRMSKRLFAVAAFRMPVPALVERVAVRAQRARLAELQASAEAFDDTTLAAWEQDLARLEQVEQKLAELTDEVDGLRIERDALQDNVDVLVRSAGSAVPAGEPDDGVPAFATVREAIVRAARDLTHLTFHPRALDTAAKCPYRWPNRIYDDLAALDEIVGRWQATGRLPGGWYDAATESGLVWANDVSQTARIRYRTDYEITMDDGAKETLGPHIGRASETGPAGHYRAYLHIDNDSRRVTVGYVGRHLRGARGA